MNATFLRAFPPIVLAACLMLVWASCGGDDDDQVVAVPGTLRDAQPAPAPSRAWTLSSEDLCSMLTADEVTAAVGTPVQAEANPFNGCLYTAAQLLARLTESALSETEYPAFIAALGLRTIELGDGAVIATNADGRAIAAWFKAGEQALEIVFTTSVATEECTELMAATRSTS